jgi:hypothetical protein
MWRRESLWLVAVLVCLWAPRGAAADCARPFADPNQVLTFHLRMSRADWDKLRFDSVPDGVCDRQNPYYKAEFRCGDADPWLTVGVRKKRGDQRGRDTDQKPPIKIDFNREVMGQSWPAALGKDGYRKLSLNNGQADNTGGMLSALLTEHMALRYLRREIPTTPESAYSKLYVHLDGKTQYHGLYLVIEDIDRNAIQRRFGKAHAGRLAKTTNSCRDDVVYDDGPPNEARRRAEAWLSRSPQGDWAAESDRALELEDLLRQEAARDLLGNRNDTPMGTYYNNYLIFEPRDGKRRYIPWDLDDTIGQGSRPPPTTPIIPSCSPVGSRTRCHSSLQKRYLEIMCQLANGTLSEKRLVPEFEAVDKVIRPIIAEEVEPVWKGKNPLATTTDLPRGTYGTEFVRGRQWLRDRVPEVRRQIAARGVPCPTGCRDGASEPCMHLACAGVRRCEGGEWTACKPAAPCGTPAAVVEAPDAGAVSLPPRPAEDAARDAAALPSPAAPGTAPAPAPGPAQGPSPAPMPPAPADAGAPGTPPPGPRPAPAPAPAPSDDEPGRPTKASGNGGCSLSAGAGEAPPVAVVLLLTGLAAWQTRRRRGGSGSPGTGPPTSR